MNNKQII